MRSVSHLWILDCPVHNRATVQRHVFTQIYTTLITIMTSAINVLASPLGPWVVEK